MNLTTETINILFFLIPGFLSSVIVGLIVVRKELSFSNKLIEAMIFNFIIYSITIIFVDVEPFASIGSDKSLITFEFTRNYKFFIVLLLLSLIIPIIAGCISYYDAHMWILRKLKITDKTSRDTTWQDIFIEQKRDLVISLKDGRSIQGWPQYYSNTPEEGFIYLNDPAWIDDENNYIECNTDGILLNYNDIDFIEFMKKEEEKSYGNINIRRQKQAKRKEETKTKTTN